MDVTFFELESMFAYAKGFQASSKDVVYRRMEVFVEGEWVRNRGREDEKGEGRAYHLMGCIVEMLLAPDRQGSYVPG